MGRNVLDGAGGTGGGGPLALGGSLGGTTASGTVLAIDGNAGTCVLGTNAAILAWALGTTSPTLKQSDQTANSTNGQALTIQAQNATGTTSTGGNLVLASGTGTTAAGSLLGKVGATTALQLGLASSDFLSMGGATVGSAGVLRFANNIVIGTARNAANGADITLFATTSGNNFYVGCNSGFSGTMPPSTFIGGVATVLTSAASNYLFANSGTLRFENNTTAYTVLQLARATDAATFDLTIQSQAPFASATGTNRNPGNLVLVVPSPVAGGAAGKHSFKVSGTEQFSIQSGTVDFATMTTTGTAPGAGGAGALPATPAGYMTVKIAGTNRQIAYY